MYIYMYVCICIYIYILYSHNDGRMITMTIIWTWDELGVPKFQTNLCDYIVCPCAAFHANVAWTLAVSGVFNSGKRAFVNGKTRSISKVGALDCRWCKPATRHLDFRTLKNPWEGARNMLLKPVCLMFSSLRVSNCLVYFVLRFSILSRSITAARFVRRLSHSDFQWK